MPLYLYEAELGGVCKPHQQPARARFQVDSKGMRVTIFPATTDF